MFEREGGRVELSEEGDECRCDNRRNAYDKNGGINQLSKPRPIHSISRPFSFPPYFSSVSLIKRLTYRCLSAFRSGLGRSVMGSKLRTGRPK